ncbi:MAG: ATP-dependent DNA helicase RecG [Bacillota bacterium]
MEKYNLDMSIKNVKGVGKRKKKLLNKLEIYTIDDILKHYPISYENKKNIFSVSSIQNGQKVTTKGKIIKISKKITRRNKKLLIGTVKDFKSCIFEIVFFNYKYVINKLIEGQEYYFYGKFKNNQIIHPEFIFLNSSNKKLKDFLKIKPIYPLTEGLKQWQLEKIVKEVLENIEIYEKEKLYSSIVKSKNLCPYMYALKNIHFPKNEKAYKVAKYRLIFQEFFDYQLAMYFLKTKFNREDGIKFKKNKKVEKLINSLPFELTNAQKNVLDEIFKDMEKQKTMNRIVQGDVGSGKTIVGILAIYLAVLNGYQASFMAPTEILAKQHFKEFKNIIKDENIKIKCLTSSTKNKEKLYKEIKSGKIDILIGTHALLQDNVYFDKLGLIITDEQHRFGVRQRELLKQKTDLYPDVLVMSATPIPRTLSMILYGDLELSIIDEMPKGRKPVITKYVPNKKRNDMYGFLKKEIDLGRQVFFVCPLVDKNEDLELTSVTQHLESLKEFFKEYKVQMVHGQMKTKEKNQIMSDFKNKKIDILVSTTVIEVGIDIPNANIMVIENVERFGLSQLHQLRGRVGRGKHQSYCFLLGEKLGETAKKRIKIMVTTNDGFLISKKDLEIRGPGEVLGTKQHGIAEFKLANILKHNDILIETQKVIKKLIKYYKEGDNGKVVNFMNKKSQNIINRYKIK